MASLIRRVGVLGALAAFACGVPDYSGFKEKPQEDGGGGLGGTAGTGNDAGAPGDAGAAGDAGAPGDAGDAADAGCKSNAGCTEPLGVCDTSTGACVKCLPSPNTCPLGAYCEGNTTCVVGCNEDGDCVGQDAGAGGSGGGAQDGAAGAAGSGGAAGASGAAGSGGATPGDAATGDAGSTLTCDKQKHLCKGCQLDSQCPPGTVCDAASQYCIKGCLSSTTCPSGFDCCQKQCVDMQSDVDHCSACDKPCKPTGGSGKCEAGVCKVAQCDPGLADCNFSAADGCETTLSLDPLHCGSCPNACAEPQNAYPTCQNGACGMGACKAGYEDCDSTATNGCEKNLGNDPANCGTCNLVCDLLNANEICKDGSCAVGSCAAGFADCDKTAANGCEINTQSDDQNCGLCANKCEFPNGAGTCNAGSCKLASCAAPWQDCDLQASNGCEKNLGNDSVNCGSCGKVCSSLNGTPSCNNGTCAIACNSGFGDCTSTDGCETSTNTSTSHCGGCGKACSTNNGTPSCNGGQCQIVCNNGFANCNGDVSDGCEINTTNNVNNCASCGYVCPKPGGGTPNCVDSKCGISSCTPPQADCNGSPADGCEVNTSNDSSNCGACGTVCFAANGTAACTSSNCTVASCNGGFDNCDGLYSNGCEKNLKTDVNNCNACGAVCSSVNGTPSCNNGACSIACNPGFADCTASPGCETNTNTSSTNCGGCNITCTNLHGSTTCSSGVCAPTCAAGWGDCDGDPKNGCETSLTTLSDCGSCGMACALANANEDCSTGQCQVTSCLAAYGNCNGLDGDGCETNINSSVSNCGGCGSACSTNNGAPSCSGGNCLIACNGGFADCNSNPRVDGCEVNLSSDPLNCSTCGLVCPLATPNCVGGTCISACPSGYGDCDGIPGNGCESNLNTSHDKCGSCTTVCGSSEYCSTGVCTSCGAGTLDCDKNGGNGCEAITASDPNACGSCANKCGSDGTCGCASSTCSGGTVYFSEDFSDKVKGWTLQGEWEIGPTSTSSGQQQGFPDPASDHSTTSDNGVLGIVLGGNYANPVAGPNYATSPVIDLSGAAGTVKLTFWRWLNCDWDPYVVDTVDVFNGTSWIVLWASTSAGKNLITENSWTRYEYDVAAYKNANFRVRFSHKTGKQGQYLAWIMSGWNIDDVTLSSATCN